MDDLRTRIETALTAARDEQADFSSGAIRMVVVKLNAALNFLSKHEVAVKAAQEKAAKEEQAVT